MPTFTFTELVNDPLAQIETVALGTGSAEYDQDDLGKAVKMSGANTMVLCVEGDEVEGFIKSIEPSTVNGGYSYGSVQRNRRMLATVGANQASTISLYGHVVADAQAAAGAAGIAEVKDGTAASQLGSGTYDYTERTPNTFLWRVIRIVSGTGVTGDTVLLERI